jgi:predicted dehydrogenase
MVLRAAVVGCGRIGCGFDDDPLRKTISTHAGAYSHHPKTKLDAFCDIDVEKLKKYGKKYSVNNLFTNIDELLEKTKPDLISVCTQVHQHEEITIKAAKAGVKGIFCEKPIADSITAAKNMIDVCEKNGVILMIDHQRRFDPLFRTIKNAIENNILGKIYHSTFYYTAGIHNTGTHAIDLMRYFFGDIEWIVGRFSQVKSPNPNDPNIDGFLGFKSGVLASIHALDVNNFLIFEQDILGSNGRLRILNSGAKIEYYKISDSKYFTGYKELEMSNLPFNVPEKREFMIEGIESLVNSIETRTRPISSGYDGLQDLEAILALITSAEDDSKKVYLPLK